MPTPAESNASVQLLSQTPQEEKRVALEDLFWALLTSREFLFQH
jgi:hypothetical protein